MKLRKIYARVQQLHNTSFERDKSEQEQKREKLSPAHTVEDVWNRGSWDAFEVTYLFLALARAAGLRADLAVVSTRDQYFFNQRLTNPKQLNSNLVIVNLSNHRERRAYFRGAEASRYALRRPPGDSRPRAPICQSPAPELDWLPQKPRR